ncbi:LPS assembly protein LptD [Testudinibacter sp. TR-2022]|uniref:LPS assembly protein LptD n=1 Tax=Testudinibacter sp. TR-2022 TaxID=2585029 RepID=UPI001118CB6E|nr:LPS assembly protein LptD [Testudinibacter sp. TR-2022]TNH05151.1 LPS assembly protein LptD [Pasteurellaceae bacterium Phil31]TNH09671.1 LPS assembly protein LptD [Testudinibacter sp. TR-2022]TNH11157.1 LPS assembly protein LptD [Testudinibacter sp. TR-2022]TNH14947.1 LPS assembly protein LptD [Testudinibacter sp. TR-2022]TNH20396.1 LPS assembly protein LptD [Testudinibacter sp. TR-2022]
MKKNTYSLLATLILSALYGTVHSSTAQADLRQQCLLGVPHFSGTPVAGNPNDLPVYIEANRGEMSHATEATYQGDVDIQQGNRRLQSQYAKITTQDNAGQLTRFAYIDGDLQYRDEQIDLKGRNAKINLNSKDSDLQNADYQFVGRQGRGTAQQAEMRERYRTLHNATFTSCLPNDNAWSIEANEIRQDLQEEVAEMWGARFKVLGVPILYSPYWQLPLGDRRRSGLLMPQFSMSSRDGFSYAQPIYWNIAPNYDATFTPKMMTDRGLQLLTEFRYLTQFGLGTVATEYLHRDRLKTYLGSNKSRHLFFWQHAATFGDWRLNVDYTKVSDKRYFNDFSSEYGNSTDGYATQKFSLGYYQPNYNLVISGRQFQIFDEAEIGPYRALPQIDFNYYKNGLANGWLDFALFSQAVHFDNDSSYMPKAWRFHVQPELNLPLSNDYGSLNLQTKLYATHYRQTSGKGENAEAVQSSVNRVLPQFKADLQTILLNSKSVFEGYTQTLEPHVQYLYRPYKNQSNIGAQDVDSNYLGLGYDSALLQQDYFSLFRDRRYSGLDRIASANQVTVGGTTRFFDQHSEERFNFSLGQIYYLTASRIDESEDNSTSRHSSSWSMQSNWKINSDWSWRGSYQYDTVLNKTALANMALEFNPSGHNLVQLNYRYASQDYINQNLQSGANRYNQDIKQIGATVAWDIDDNWAIIGRYYHDVALNKPVEQYGGIQYNSCCWSVGIGARRYLTSSNRSDTADQVFYDNSIAINFEIRGLGSNYSSGLRSMLQKGMLPYVKPFSLE